MLSELALRRLDGTFTLGQSKGVDVVVLSERTGRTFKVEVKTTEGGIRGNRWFGAHYSWLMDERHGRVHADDLIYAFVLFEGGPESATKPRVFLVPSSEVATYVVWNQRYWERKTGRAPETVTSKMRQFRLPAPGPSGTIPAAWRDGRWARWEGNWGIFDRDPERTPRVKTRRRAAARG